jgi:hemerythrin superfamily protein
MEKRTEKIASDVMGAVKATKGKLQGQTGVFEQLTREHGEVTALLLRLKTSSDPKLRSELFPKIRAELLSHEKGELTVVYPVFRKHTELAGFAEEHESEAGAMEQTINELSAIGFEDEGWGEKFESLLDQVQHHTQEEEDEFFPTASKVLGKAATETMKSPYLEQKSAVMAKEEERHH